MEFVDKLKGAFGLGADPEEDDLSMVDLGYHSKVIPLQSVRHEQPTVILMTPVDFEGCKDLADQLKNKAILTINLSKVDASTAKRIVDFCVGVVYGLDGEVLKADDRVYIFAGKGVNLSECRSKTDTASLPWER